MAPNVLELTLLLWLGAVVAGIVGALTGLGGGIVIVPMLTLLFKVDMRYAIGAALISVIATSSGAAASYVREGYSNIRVGMFLEVATTAGARRLPVGDPEDRYVSRRVRVRFVALSDRGQRGL